MLIIGLVMCAAIVLLLIRPPDRGLVRAAAVAVGCAGIAFVAVGHARDVTHARGVAHDEAIAPLRITCQNEAAAIETYLARSANLTKPVHGVDDIQEWIDLGHAISLLWQACTDEFVNCPPNIGRNVPDLKRAAHALKTGDACSK